jgi:hypothetical protein
VKHALLSGCLVVALAMAFGSTRAAPPANRGFQNTWQRTDLPVAGQQVSRTWMWGPQAFTDALREDYAESPGGGRLVQYFDKSRMELTDPDADPASIWYVTNGLLVMELVTGRVQLGDGHFEQHEPALVNIAGDFDDTSGPTYAALQNLLYEPLGFPEDPRITRIDRQGNLTDDPSLAERGIFATYYVVETNHRVAVPFWDFMNSSGLVYQDGAYTSDRLFADPFFATGYPITEAYWATVKVGGELKDVLLQCFERRCLTYTPDNDPGWQVESGNVGQHYYQWRYQQLGFTPNPQPYPTTGDVRVVFVLADPVDFGESEGEYVDVRNFDNMPISMAGWRLEDAAGNGYDFPSDFVLGLDATVRVHICNGTNDAANLYWGRCSAVWNNDGDTARLINPFGIIVHEYSY